MLLHTSPEQWCWLLFRKSLQIILRIERHMLRTHPKMINLKLQSNKSKIWMGNSTGEWVEIEIYDNVCIIRSNTAAFPLIYWWEVGDQHLIRNSFIYVPVPIVGPCAWYLLSSQCMHRCMTLRLRSIQSKKIETICLEKKSCIWHLKRIVIWRDLPCQRNRFHAKQEANHNSNKNANRKQKKYIKQPVEKQLAGCAWHLRKNLAARLFVCFCFAVEKIFFDHYKTLRGFWLLYLYAGGCCLLLLCIFRFVSLQRFSFVACMSMHALMRGSCSLCVVCCVLGMFLVWIFMFYYYYYVCFHTIVYHFCDVLHSMQRKKQLPVCTLHMAAHFK